MAKKWAVLAVLFFLPINLVEAHNRVSVEAGHEAVLSCPYTFKVPFLLVTWRSSCSSCCLLSYRTDLNKTSRLNCSERIKWNYSSVSDPELRIYPVSLRDEGNYTCEIASREGNFHFSSSLTVIVPPTVALTQDKSRVAVCQASAGKPPADISWIPASNHSSEEEFHHPNGTVTRVSYFGWASSSFPSVTCLVTHPAMNQTLVMELRDTSHDFPGLLYIVIGAAAGVGAVTGLTLCLIFKCRATKKKMNPTPVETRTPRMTKPFNEGKNKTRVCKRAGCKRNKNLTYEGYRILKEAFQELGAARGRTPDIPAVYPVTPNHFNFLPSYFQLAGYVNRHVARQNTLQLKPGSSHLHVREEKQSSLLTFQSKSMRITTQDLFMYAYNSVGTSSQLSY